MKIYYLLAVLFILFITSCATKNYHAVITVKNSSGASVFYKLTQLDSLSNPNSTSGDQVINTINPIHSPISNGVADTLDISWTGSYSYARFKVFYGSITTGNFDYNTPSWNLIDDSAVKNVTLGAGGVITIN
jgi:hypothetical protein